MPQGLKKMNQNDGANFALATITGWWSWLTAENLAIIVPCLWALYVLMLMAKTAPEVLEKHPWIMRLVRACWRGVSGAGRWFVSIFKRGAK